MQRGDSDKAQDIFERLLNLEGAYAEEHKHLFNEFGINLRKTKMFDQAVEYYERALTLTTNDEGIYINIARTLLDKKDFTKCTENLLKALELAPTHESGRKFLEWLLAKNLVPQPYITLSESALAMGKPVQEETNDEIAAE